jgi:hypothetical protein
LFINVYIYKDQFDCVSASLASLSLLSVGLVKIHRFPPLCSIPTQMLCRYLKKTGTRLRLLHTRKRMAILSLEGEMDCVLKLSETTFTCGFCLLKSVHSCFYLILGALNNFLTFISAQDMKCVGMGYLEAMRNLIQSGFQPLRTIHCVFVPGRKC